VSPPTIAFHISGHGFGHASRAIEVLNRIHARAARVRLVVRTPAPRWLFDLTLTAPIDWRPVEGEDGDTGMVQIDSLRLDVGATLARAASAAARLPARAAAEAQWLRDEAVTLVVSDIPPVASAAAREAGLPSVAVGNFTWDWIYAAYEPEIAAYPDLVPALRRAYAGTPLALRLPLHGGFEPFARVEDVPFIARRSTRPRGETRRRFGLPADRPLVLTSFGGYGLRDIDLGRLAGLRDWMVVTTSNVQAPRRGATLPDPQAGGRTTRDATGLPETVRLVDERDVYAAGYRYEDLVAAVDVVATKPGYGIIAECVANGAAMLYTSRGRFVEYDVMVHEMPRYLRCAFISNDDLLAGRWQDPLDALHAQGPPPPRPRVDGAEVVADRILRTIDLA
jgi:hypothetical protein